MLVCRLKENIRICCVSTKLCQPIEYREMCRDVVQTMVVVLSQLCNGIKEHLQRCVGKSCSVYLSVWTCLIKVILDHASILRVRVTNHYVSESYICTRYWDSTTDTHHQSELDR